MLCCNCGSPSSQVIYLKHNFFKNHVERRRECLKCEKRYTTLEILKDKGKENIEPVPVSVPINDSAVVDAAQFRMR